MSPLCSQLTALCFSSQLSVSSLGRPYLISQKDPISFLSFSALGINPIT